ncbi:MAG: hypothetical protein R3E77_02435 [Steroidobacteraceae bacterium]
MTVRTTILAVLISLCSVALTASVRASESDEFEIAEPGPELPGDRAKSCWQIAEEMATAMHRHGADRVAAKAGSDVCAARKLAQQQARVGTPVNAPMGPMMQLMNDARFQRLILLAEEKRCGEQTDSRAPAAAAPVTDPCTGERLGPGQIPADVSGLAKAYRGLGGVSEGDKTSIQPDPFSTAAPAAPKPASDPFKP